MKSIQTNIIIGSIRSRRDGSLGFSAETPELDSNEKVAFMDLQGQVIKALLVPDQSPEAPVLKVDKELGDKTPGQRLRSTLFVLWKQRGEQGEFDTFYRDYMERFINRIKEELE